MRDSSLALRKLREDGGLLGERLFSPERKEVLEAVSDLISSLGTTSSIPLALDPLSLLSAPGKEASAQTDTNAPPAAFDPAVISQLDSKGLFIACANFAKLHGARDRPVLFAGYCAATLCLAAELRYALVPPVSTPLADANEEDTRATCVAQLLISAENAEQQWVLIEGVPGRFLSQLRALLAPELLIARSQQSAAWYRRLSKAMSLLKRTKEQAPFLVAAAAISVLSGAVSSIRVHCESELLEVTARVTANALRGSTRISSNTQANRASLASTAAALLLSEVLGVLTTVSLTPIAVTLQHLLLLSNPISVLSNSTIVLSFTVPAAL
jgi:hypothetical protein